MIETSLTTACVSESERLLRRERDLSEEREEAQYDAVVLFRTMVPKGCVMLTAATIPLLLPVVSMLYNNNYNFESV